MENRFQSLPALDGAAKALETESCFRLHLACLPDGELRASFRRGAAIRAGTDAERRALQQRILDNPSPPGWIVDVPELKRLAGRLADNGQESAGTPVYLIELAFGRWTLRYGPYLCYTESGEALGDVVIRTAAALETRAAPAASPDSRTG